MIDINKDRVTLEELMVSTLAMADAVTKLLIEKGVISEAEFKEQLLKEASRLSGAAPQPQTTLAHQPSLKGPLLGAGRLDRQQFC